MSTVGEVLADLFGHPFNPAAMVYAAEKRTVGPPNSTNRVLAEQALPGVAWEDDGVIWVVSPSRAMSEPAGNPNGDNFSGPAGPADPAAWLVVSGAPALDGAGHLALPSSLDFTRTRFKSDPPLGTVTVRWSQVPDPSNASRLTYLMIRRELYPDASYLRLDQTGGQLKVRIGASIVKTVTFDPSALVWRFRVATDMVYVETSPNETVWTLVHSFAAPAWLVEPCLYDLGGGATASSGVSAASSLADSFQLS